MFTYLQSIMKVEELLTAHKTTCAYRLCMRLPRFASKATG